MAALENILDEVFACLFVMEENNCYEDLLVVIKNCYPNLRGCSLRSIKRFCSYHGIKKRMSVADETVDIAVEGAISEVGPTYGQKIMKGYLDMKAKCTFASERRVQESLSRVAPLYHYHRQTGTERQINLHPYVAKYHGHKLDQNEKLAAYGVVHVCSIDGFSRKAVLEDCLLDQVRVDHGWEFYLTLFVQESLAPLRRNTQRDPHRQTESKHSLKNLRIERFWVEVNAWGNYPIKNALWHMEQRGIVDIELEDTKFYVSNVTLRVATVGVGTPEQLHSNNLQGQNIPATQIPTSQEAVAAYENLGRRLAVFPSLDPLADNVALQDTRERRFNGEADIATVVGDIVNGIATSFEQTIQRYANLTTQLLP